MINYNRIQKLLTIFIVLLFTICSKEVKSAEKIIFVDGAFSRTIEIKEIEEFINNGKAKGILKKIIINETPDSTKAFLTKEYNAPLLVTSKLINSQVGEVVLTKLSKIIYPFKMEDEKTRVLALKAATIKTIDINNEKISLLEFLKSYPNKTIAVDVPELYKALNNIGSSSEMIKYFTNTSNDNL